MKCPCENCIIFVMCKAKVNKYSFLTLIYNKKGKCQLLDDYLHKCKGSTMYYRMHRAEKILGIEDKKKKDRL